MQGFFLLRFRGVVMSGQTSEEAKAGSFKHLLEHSRFSIFIFMFLREGHSERMRARDACLCSFVVL